MNIRPKNTISDRERGIVTAEFVIIVPMLLFLFFLMVDFGWLLKNWLVVTNAARESTRCAIASSCTYDFDDGSGPVPVSPETIALARMHNSGVSTQTNLAADPVVEATYVDQDLSGGINQGDTVVVCIRADNQYITPVLPFLSFISGGGGNGGLPDPMPLAAREEMLVDFVEPDGILEDLAPGNGKCDDIF
jgi:Flp pilus assembly protein TadG